MIVHQRLAERVFLAFVLAVILLVVGYRHVWQELAHPVSPDKFAVDAERTLSVVRQTRLVLDLYERGAVTRTYFQAFAENVAHRVTDDLRGHVHQRPAPDLAARYDAYRALEAQVAEVASSLAAPTFPAAQVTSHRERLAALERALTPLVVKP